MNVIYLTADNSLVSVCHVGALRDGRANWQVRVDGAGGAAVWGTRDFPAPPTWSAEKVARIALEWAFGLPDAPPCRCSDPDCPGKESVKARDIFGPTDPHVVELVGPYFDRDDAITAACVQSGVLDHDDAVGAMDQRDPTIEELVAELDGKPVVRQPKPLEKPSDPYDGSTWKLG